MSTPESENPEFRQALQDAMDGRYNDPTVQPAEDPHKEQTWEHEAATNGMGA